MGKKDEAVLVPGSKYRVAYRATVVSVLKGKAPPVISQGERFYNVDQWTARKLLNVMCKWAGDNPGKAPSSKDVQIWCDEANQPDSNLIRCIVIAETPDQISLRTAMALVGGAYHEAWHSHYDRTSPIYHDEVYSRLLERWDKIEDWSQYREALLEWDNVIRDIRIERLGIREFPGSATKMADLQDYVLCKEFAAREKSSKPTTAYSATVCLFRDMGLGYVTTEGKQAMSFYAREHPKVYELVVRGPLRPLLNRCVLLKGHEDLDPLFLAMDVLALLKEQADLPPDNKSEKVNCPACGSQNLKGSLQPDGSLLIVCQDCGAQMQAMPAEGEGNTGQGQASVGGQGSQAGGQGSQAGGQGSQAGGSSNGGDNGLDTGCAPMSGPGGIGDENSTSGGKDKSSRGAGGYKYDPGPWRGSDYSSLAQEILQGSLEGSDRLDSATALQAELKALEERKERTVRKDEKPWRPFTTAYDEVLVVEPSYAGRAHDQRQATYLLDSVRKESSYLRARLRNLIRALRVMNVRHGVRQGKGLSERMLVDSVAHVRAGAVPTRAFYEVDEAIDTTMAAAVIVDESGSMSGWKREAARILMAITEPLDSLGAAVQVSGFRDGPFPPRNIPQGGGFRVQYHRTGTITHDLFKKFDEPFRSIKWRFANTRATGGTPMSDGIQFAISGIMGRPETHRFIFVVTDGDPNHNHYPVINYQIRTCQESGIHLIGVGMGKAAQYVTTLFPDHVWCPSIPELPAKLIAKLNQLVDRRFYKAAG